MAARKNNQWHQGFNEGVLCALIVYWKNNEVIDNDYRQMAQIVKLDELTTLAKERGDYERSGLCEYEEQIEMAKQREEMIARLEREAK